MPRGRPVVPIMLSDDDKSQLLSLANSRALPHGVVQRAQIVLACASGEANSAIAKRLRLTNATVGKWRKRYSESGVDGPRDIQIEDGWITAIEEPGKLPINNWIDATKALVTPGLIDMHAHPAVAGSKYGVDPDRYLLSRGTTTVLSQGDAGAKK